jgi:hypothetical protein
MFEDTISLRSLYDAFNKREIEIVLALMHADVKWANGLEGGFVDGRDNVREYWKKQFANSDPQLEPLVITSDDSGRSLVKVHQIVRNLQGEILLEKTIRHIFTIEGGLIRMFEIEEEQVD